MLFDGETGWPHRKGSALLPRRTDTKEHRDANCPGLNLSSAQRRRRVLIVVIYQSLARTHIPTSPSELSIQSTIQCLLMVISIF